VVVTLPPPIQFPTFPYSQSARLFTTMLWVTTAWSNSLVDKQNRLADIKQKETEGNIQTHKQKKPTRTANPTNNITPFYHISI
jgi:hypothetical protein